MLMGVDHEVPPALIKEISAVTGFDETKYIDLSE